MDASRLINMILSRVMRSVVNKGINAGIGAMSKRGGKTDANGADKSAAPRVSDAPNAGGTGPSTSRDTQKKLRQANRMARRLGRF